MIGLAVQTFVLVRSTVPPAELVRVALVPIVVGTLAYVRNRPTAAALELGIVAVWGVFAQRIASYAWYIVVIPSFAGEVSISATLLSGAAVLRLMVLLRFLGMAAVFAGFYAAAASRRDRPIVSVITLFAVPVVLVVIYAIV
ncbi:hypothetical protein [Halosolutus halophilus]|uniref:hypothetical protein n=1 Tax=Halosolutus halophilus TaxID=1552990 RepID=UPI00223505A0|nr:hypothetical protein [Halosolutus halophilus]